jgi:peroxiredoxin
MTRVDVIANERLLDVRHHWHEIQDFWQDGPVALVFLRQFGSAFALKQARVLNAAHDEIVAGGGNVVLIGLGTPIHGFTFKKRSETRFTVLTTADRTLYRTMGLQTTRGFPSELSAVSPLLQLAREGIYPYQSTGDNDLLGGVFVATQGGLAVTWDFRAHRTADVVPASDIVAALKSSVAANGPTSVPSARA